MSFEIHNPADLDHLMEKAAEAHLGVAKTSSTPRDSSQVADATGDVFPDIRVNGRELRETSTEATQALIVANAPPQLFVRAGTVARVDQAEQERPIIVVVTDVHLRGEMIQPRR